MNRPLNPAERIAEAPKKAFIDRVVETMHDLRLLLDSADAETFAADEPWDELAALRTSAEKLADEAELHRPTVYPRF